MKMLSFISFILPAVLSLCFPRCVFGYEPEKLSNSKTVFENIRFGDFHNDSIHRLDFRYADRKRGFKPLIAPAALISAGTILHFSDAKYKLNNWVQDNFHYSGAADDYLRYAPLAAVYSLNALGIKGKNNFGNLTAISVKSFVLNDLIVYSLKKWVNEERPSGGNHSFPSGHTSVTFAFAQIMHHELGEQSVWYSVGAYSCAATVGLMRIAKGAHWASDVLAGAGIGMLSTELIYLTHQYKWDWAHIKRFDIFPFSIGPHKGLTLVYNF
ncbi:MAG: phosphatase PAP2 family protein [Draconibacterium sp.]